MQYNNLICQLKTLLIFHICAGVEKLAPNKLGANEKTG